MSFIPFAEKIERDFSHASLSIFLKLFGAKTASRYFIRSLIVRRTKARILWFHKQISLNFGLKAADDFVVDYLSTTPRSIDYSTMLLSVWVSSEALAASMPAILPAATKSTASVIALVSALIERGDADLACYVITAVKGNARLASLVDWNSLARSLTPRHLYDTAPAASFDAESMHPGRCKNRLIVMDEKLSPMAIKSLAAGAEKITLLQYGDLYGRIDLAAIQAVLPDVVISVEHGRHRIERFQQSYFDIHQKTFEAAEELSKSFIENSPWLGKAVPGVTDFARDLTLDLSDKFFFKALRIEAIYQAVIDPAFDSVIVSFGEGFELFRFFFADSSLWQSSRIKGCCRSQKIGTATKYAERVAEMQWRTQVGHRDPILSEIAEKEELFEIDAAIRPSVTVSEYLDSAGKAARRTKRHSTGRKSIALVTDDSRAYMRTAAQIATHLNTRFDVDVLATQGSPANLQTTIRQARIDPYLKDTLESRKIGLVKIAVKAPSKAVSKEFSDEFLVAVADAARKLFAKYDGDLCFRTMLGSMLKEGLSEATLHVMGNARAIAAHLKEENYSAVAISPIRLPRNTQFSTIARSAGVPSIAIEPHCLNSAYCRYGTVPTDYAAVYSDYFAQEYDRHFGMPRSRSYTFGSPRIMRPIDYDPMASRPEARKRIGFLEGDPPIIAFATQPMPAEHILAVWRMIIRAVKNLDTPVRVILKRHPEEGSGHVGRYRQMISEENAGDLCSVSDIDIKDLLIASEVVLTCYSTTAIEAAILERNVAIVSLEGVEYPMAWNEIIGVPLCTSSDQISKVISDALGASPTGKNLIGKFKLDNPELFDNSTFERLATSIEEVIANGAQGIRRSEDLPSSLFVTGPFREYLA